MQNHHKRLPMKSKEKLAPTANRTIMKNRLFCFALKSRKKFCLLPPVKTTIMRWRYQSKIHLMAAIKKLKSELDLYVEILEIGYRKINSAWAKVMDWQCKGIRLILHVASSFNILNML